MTQRQHAVPSIWSLHPVHLVLAAAVAATAVLCAPAQGQEDPYRRARLKMVEERVEREGVTNPAVLKSIREVPRHLFVAPKWQSHAYTEEIIDIGHKQTLSTAYIVAYMTQAIDPQPSDRVLEIGTGSGFQASVLSKIVKEVYSIEIVEPLAKEAAERLKRLGFKNVKTKPGDGFKGWPEYAPFDKIIITCSPETVPQPLIDQLKEGGKLIVPLGKRYSQAFYLYEKRDGKLIENKLLPTQFVPMTGMADALRKEKENWAQPRIVNGGFEELTGEVPDGWFYQRQVTLEHKKAPEGKHYITFSNREPGRDAHALQAIGIDGAKVKRITLSLWIQIDGTQRGTQDFQQPGLDIRFFDKENRRVGEEYVGPWIGTSSWQKVVSKPIKVPRGTHMAMMQLGLRGATGRLSVDDVRLTSSAR
jgi:protein-L-isoaspartate(D-aspartate) O-methyltransferase